MTGGHAAASSEGLFGKLASLARSVFTVRPLLAAPHATSPTGGIGGFASEYYAFETPPDGVLELLNFPVQDATTGGEIVGADGQPLRVRARTSSSTPENPTGIEQVFLEFALSDNNGPVPSGKELISLDPSNQDVVCVNTDPLPSWHGSTPPPGNICRVRTGEDQLSAAGIGVFEGIASTKTGGFSTTIREWEESPSPFTFAEISAGKFNVTPN